MESERELVELDRVSLFLGRAPELERIRALVLNDRQPVVWISGEPGTGKTALAYHFAHVHKNEFPGGVYNVSASALQPLTPAMLAQFGSRRVPHLVILNDVQPAEHPQLMPIFANRSLVPEHASIIVTSRSQLPRGILQAQIILTGLQRADVSNFLKLSVSQGSQDHGGGLEALMNVTDGNPRLVRTFLDLANQGNTPLQEVFEGLQPFEGPGIVDQLGRPLSQSSPEYGRIISDVHVVSEELLRSLSNNPKALYDLSPRRFEEIVAEVLSRLGYDVRLTASSKDGGKDIYAAQKSHLGTFLFIVECKRYAADSPVGVDVIRQLHGVVQAEKATAGIVATTSFFTRGAKEFQRKVPSQLSLADYLRIQQWLKSALKSTEKP